MAKVKKKIKPAAKAVAQPAPAPTVTPTPTQAALPGVDATATPAEAARAAQQREDWPLAARLWAQARAKTPDSLVAYDEGLVCLGHAGLLAEREALFGQAAETFSTEPRFSVEHAWLAHHRRDWPAAIERWTTLNKRFPGHLTYHLGAAATYSAAGMAEKADAVLEAGAELHPDNRDIQVAYARQAQARGDLDLALKRWEAMRVHLPHEALGYSFGAMTLFDAGRPDDVTALLTQAVKQLSDFATRADGLPTVLNFARDPMRYEQWQQAHIRLGALRKAFAANTEIARDHAACAARITP